MKIIYLFGKKCILITLYSSLRFLRNSIYLNLIFQYCSYITLCLLYISARKQNKLIINISVLDKIFKRVYNLFLNLILSNI